MKEVDRFDLLGDLAWLVKKYEPAVFADLVNLLRDPSAMSDLVALLGGLESAGRKARARKRSASKRPRNAKSGVGQLIGEIEKEDPEKAKWLSFFYKKLIAKKIFPSLQKVRGFAHDSGLSMAKATSREKAIVSLLQDLATRPLQDIRSLVSGLGVDDEGDDRTLEGWTNVILGKKRS